MEKNQFKDCGECNYCKRKCPCPACNGYPPWGGCAGCRNPVQQSSVTIESKKVKDEDEDKVI